MRASVADRTCYAHHNRRKGAGANRPMGPTVEPGFVLSSRFLSKKLLKIDLRGPGATFLNRPCNQPGWKRALPGRDSAGPGAVVSWVLGPGCSARGTPLVIHIFRLYRSDFLSIVLSLPGRLPIADSQPNRSLGKLIADLLLCRPFCIRLPDINRRYTTCGLISRLLSNGKRAL